MLADLAEERGERGTAELLRVGSVWVSTTGGRVFASREAAIAWGDAEARRHWGERARRWVRIDVLSWWSEGMAGAALFEIIMTKIEGL